MMVLHDGNGNFMEIEMIGDNGVAWEHDFFELKPNEYDIPDNDPFFEQLKEPYKTDWWRVGTIHYVDDVYYCLDQALDCKNRVGDFSTNEENNETFDVNARIYEFNHVVI